MDVRCSIFKLLWFQLLVAWCSAKVVVLPNLEVLGGVENDVQDSIRNLLHTGIYSHQHLDPAQAQVVTPVKVSSSGELVSHTLEHSHVHGHARARRDLHGRDHELPHEVHYNLTVDGRELRLDLRPSVTFITPAMIVERHAASGRTRDRPHSGATACHYTGSVHGQPKSSIALSACDGLAGLLRTEHGEYWIEPSNQIHQDGSKGRPHVIFKRSAVDKVAAYHRATRSVENRQQNVNNPYRGLSNPNARYQARPNNQIRPNNQARPNNPVRQNNQARPNNPARQNNQARPNNPARQNRQRNNREEMDKRRRMYLEERRRRLEALRRNPTEYRKQQMRLRMEQRRMNSFSNSNSVDASKSMSNERQLQQRPRNPKSNTAQRPHRNRQRKRRRRRAKNCGTKQPPYQWKNVNMNPSTDVQAQQMNRMYRNPRKSYIRSRYEDGRRSTRSVSKPRHVEVLLVADRSMATFHKRESLETYLLTIMNMVSSLYMDPSIGNYIKVVVVKIILLEDAVPPQLDVSNNADATLTSFCRWQQKLNPNDDTDPHHHDVAILVTRQNICTQNDNPCSTLGVAHVAGMCKPDRSCSVNEDNGIMLAHTITHELGHNFGLYHDTEKIGCQRRDGQTLHIMTPIFEADTVQVAWSRCSKRDVTNFLDSGFGECLSDMPSLDEYVYPEVPAGVLFDATTQCRMLFDSEAKPCYTKPEEMCQALWCTDKNTCKTFMRPAAPGTTCGPNMWCQNTTCVLKSPSPVPRDGGWGPWSEWSECSRTCGAGVSTQSRECNNPPPENNGAYCIGDRSRYKVCNTETCPKNEPSFREVQCANYMAQSNETADDWIPYFDQDKPCDLVCVPRNGNGNDRSGGFVTDGTPCRQSVGSRDLCIAGVCYKVGCDWVVGSELEEDACGVCGGNGSACRTVQGIYNKDTTKQSGLSEVAVIPAGSRNVKIEEKVSPGNYLSIGSAKSRKLYLTGTRNQTLTEYFVAGAQAIYERDRDWEKVRISGPLAEDIKVYQRIYRGRHRNPGVTYQYTVDQKRAAGRRFSYKLTEWSPCNVTCGVGYSRRELQCLDRNRVVDLSRCYHIEPPRHEAVLSRCRAPCTHWWVGGWGQCQRCHRPGEVATKERSIYCVDKESNQVVNDSECDPATKPPKTLRCNVPAC